MRRAVEYEIRLSYHDRIQKTLPESMHAPEVGVLPAGAPAPEYDYDDPSMFYLLPAKLTILTDHLQAILIMILLNLCSAYFEAVPMSPTS